MLHTHEDLSLDPSTTLYELGTVIHVCDSSAGGTKANVLGDGWPASPGEMGEMADSGFSGRLSQKNRAQSKGAREPMMISGPPPPHVLTG